MMAVVVVVVMVEGVRGESSLIHQPDWGFWSYLDEDYTLHCLHSDLPLKPNNFIRWELPNGEFLDSSENEKYELRSDPQKQVINMNLTIRNVQDADSGIYVCHVYETQTMQNKIGHVMRGLNLGVHLYRDPFDHYKHGVLVGGCAAAALLVLLSAGCLIYKFRYRTTPKQEHHHPDVSGNSQQTAASASLGNGKETELSTVVAHDGQGELNRSFDIGRDELFTKM